MTNTKAPMTTRSNYFSIMLAVQAALLAITPVIFAITIGNENLVITRLNIIIIWFLQVGYLIWYLHKPTRELSAILKSFSGITTLTATPESKKEIFGIQVGKELTRIAESISNLRIQKEKEYLLYHKCIENALTGLLAIDESGKILASNKTFSSILGKNKIESLEKLNEIKDGLGDFISSVNAETRKMITVVNNGKIMKIYLSISVFRQDGGIIRILAIQDISNEMAVQQVETMQRFVRIMSHEILNSVTPINLLATGLIRKHREGSPCSECGCAGGLNSTETADALDAIKKRSKGLAAFTESFRKTYNVPEPVLQETDTEDLFRQISYLFREQLEMQDIRLEISVDKNIQRVVADRKLVEQVLINLVLNSCEALKSVKSPVISLSTYTINGRPVIDVRDNGQGMDAATLEKLAIPFFTTREKGSGSGLFFSRQVMRLHKGDLIILSEQGQGTTVRMMF
jgi:two-component system, NtrC family, nitrogen regulation sensor histidine kinase NtrY